MKVKIEFEFELPMSQADVDADSQAYSDYIRALVGAIVARLRTMRVEVTNWTVRG
jgi:hypothetical protein